MSYQKNENFMLEREVQYTYYKFSKSYLLFSCQVQKLLFDWQAKKYRDKIEKQLYVGWRHWPSAVTFQYVSHDVNIIL